MIHASLSSLENGDVDTRLASIVTLFQEGRRAMQSGIVTRALKHRLRIVRPNLLNRLFDQEERIRWAAGYAIAGVQDVSLPNDLIMALDERSPEVEDRVRLGVEVFLKKQNILFFQNVYLTEISEDERDWHFSLKAEVKNEPLQFLAGRPPLSSRPPWLGTTAKLRILVHLQDGNVFRKLQLVKDLSERVDLSAHFVLSLPKSYDLNATTVYVDLAIDDYWLQQMIIEGHQLESAVESKPVTPIPEI